MFIISQTLLGIYYSSQQAQKNTESRQDNGALFIPDASYNFTMLIMISESIDKAPERYMTLTYRADNSEIILMPYLKNSMIGGSTLQSAYDSGNAEGVMQTLNNGLETNISKYIRFTSATLEELFDMVGNTTLDVPKEIKYENSDGTLDIVPKGSSSFSGAQMYQYLMIPDYGQKDVQYSCKVQGTALSCFINQNFRDVTAQELDEYMKYIVGFVSTNITEQDYTAKKAALLYTFDAVDEACDYYIPYGEKSGSDYVITDESISSAKDKIKR